jgi:hypothetical protein
VSTEEKRKESQKKYREKNREQINKRVRLSQARAKAREQIEKAMARGEEPEDLEVLAQKILREREANSRVSKREI